MSSAPGRAAGGGSGRPSIRAIAHTLSIAPKTVADHVSTILGRLEVADRAVAIIRVRDAGR